MPQKRRPNHGKKRFVAPSSVPGNPRVLNFSLRRLQTDHPRFPISKCDAGFFSALLQKIKYYEDMSVDHFVLEDSTEKRHTITWANTSVPTGFPFIDPQSDEFYTDTAWQFGLFDDSGKLHPTWRVHGFLVDRTFFIVWLDCDHNLIDPYRKKDKKH